jgi:hypothetical protein
MRVARAGNWIFGFGLLGWAICTYVTPMVIKVLFTPPVSFGTNCEPAADWSMDKLIQTQMMGIIGFMLLGLIFDVYLRRRSKNKTAQ